MSESERMHRAVYRTKRWHRVRTAAKERAGYRCQRCGATGRLEVHHRVRLLAGGDPYAPEGLIVLCRRCHFGEHRRKKCLTPGRDEWIDFVHAASA